MIGNAPESILYLTPAIHCVLPRLRSHLDSVCQSLTASKTRELIIGAERERMGGWSNTESAQLLNLVERRLEISRRRAALVQIDYLNLSRPKT